MNPLNLIWIIPLSMVVGAAALALFTCGGDVPKNCRECEYAPSCRSWYGGTGCKHKEEFYHGNGN